MMQMVEFVVGLLVWGGLLGLVWLGATGWFRESKPRSAVEPSRAPAPPRPPAPPPPPSASPPPPMARPVLGGTEREAGALVDGLIIGHHLTRTHYKDRIEEQAETIDELRADVAASWYPGDDADPSDVYPHDADSDEGVEDGLDDGFEDDHHFGFDDADDD